MKTIVAERVTHEGSDWIALRFPYDPDLITLAQRLPEARWSKQMKCWHIAEVPDTINLLLNAFKGKAYVDYSGILHGPAEKTSSTLSGTNSHHQGSTGVNKDLRFSPLSDKSKSDIASYTRWMEANRYPKSTIETYTSMMVRFLRFVSPKEAQECTADDLIRIVEEYVLPNGFSQSFQNQMISSIKKFYGNIYKSVIDPGSLPRPRPQHKLPNVFSKDEVRKILNGMTNEKHRVVLSLIYACGLRRGEILHLIPSDIERDRHLLRIRQSKGFKDRVVPLSDKTIDMLDTYMKRYKPERYLFEGQVKGKAFSATSIAEVMKKACKRAGIRKGGTLHWLRHSYATHLLETGTDLRYIQELLGHKSSRTTELYTHVTTSSIQQIRSPFDDL